MAFSKPVQSIALLILVTVWSLTASVFSQNASTAKQVFDLAPAEGPINNPLKGLVPYMGQGGEQFPYSLEFTYLPVSNVMVGKGKFDWQTLETLLDKIASRGNQAVVRFFLEYPGVEEGIPKYLVDAGLKIETYTNTNTAPLPPTKSITPDYDDPNLVAAMREFIAEFGKSYDGDPRLGFITAGILGTWGEWHTYPRNDLWASKETQSAILDAYAKHFHKTPILLRYPAGPDHYDKAANADLPFGYHDDSFAWATIDTGRKEDNWFFVPALKAAGAINKWKEFPIGGEIRPEVWGLVFDTPDKWPEGTQSFEECVTQTHASWLMDSGMFTRPATPERIASARNQVRKMGYEFYISRATVYSNGDGKLAIRLSIVSQGVAPLYADWKTELAIANSKGRILETMPAPELSFAGLLPNAEPYERTQIVPINVPDLRPTTLLLRIVNPLKNGKPLRFANKSQDQTTEGWLTIGQLSDL